MAISLVRLVSLAAAPLLLLAGPAAGHGMVTSPPPRVAGNSFKAACGQQVFSTQSSDPYGNVQQLAKTGASQKDFSAASCNLALCKGMSLNDSTAATQQYTRGQTVAIKVDIRAPHTGVANVSVVDTATNSAIGQPMMAWDVYASTSSGVQKNQTDFSVTIPSSIPAGQCATAGACVVQWWWDSREVDQTYMSCVDFVLSG